MRLIMKRFFYPKRDRLVPDGYHSDYPRTIQQSHPQTEENPKKYNNRFTFYKFQKKN